MDDETRRRAFEPFFTTKGERGTGLGLATSLGLVQQAGGNMWAESAPGRGAAFHVLLPRHADADAERPVAAPAALPAAAGTATVLVAEDDDAVRAAAVRSLGHAGYTVLSAASGSAALRLASGHAAPIHLLVSDVVMPGMSGMELAEALRAARPSLRVLLVSGYTADEALRAAAAQGAVSILPKPYSPGQLVGWIAAALGHGSPPSSP